MIASQVCRWHVSKDGEDFRRRALDDILSVAEEAIRARGHFDFVLAGGGTPRTIYESLRRFFADWKNWHIYFGDERCLPDENAERNSRMAGIALLDHVPIPAANIHVINAVAGPQFAAAAYARDLQGVSDFDLVLLGLGEDGHTASLFPGNDWGTGECSADVLPVCNAPKPPAHRVSLSAARLSRARKVLFLVEGASKQRALGSWFSGHAIPASAVCPTVGVDVLIHMDPADLPVGMMKQ
jgi:6-phosphogluconolactonase